MDLSNFTIGKSHRQGVVYLGKLSKDRKRWLSRKEITEEFIELMISFVGENNILDVSNENGEKLYEISVTRL